MDNSESIQEIIKDLCAERPAALSVERIAKWRERSEQKTEQGSRLLLPPIQRSIVWSNEQIINYWDSLLRGYPPGTMMVHRAVKTGDATRDKGLDANGKITDLGTDDIQLFDGQQRMAAVLLGFGIGQHKSNRKLWVDIGRELSSESNLKFQLRITTPGQPFGYRLDLPNQKIALGERQKKWENWEEKHKNKRENAFEEVTGEDLIDAECAIPLEKILNAIAMHKDPHVECGHDVPAKLLAACERALSSKVILQVVPEEIVGDPDEYIRYFGRIGQGGSRLSEDELTYSIIKHQDPEIRNRIEDVMKVAGRLIDEVDLVLAALRVARATSIKDGQEWEIIGRPNPSFVSKMRVENKLKPVKDRFDSLLAANNSQESGSELQRRLSGLRDALAYNSNTNTTGLPPILLARLPNELVDVLLLFSVRHDLWEEESRNLLTSFVLYWLFFVQKDAKAAWKAYSHAKSDEWLFGKESLKKLITDFERDGISNSLPNQEQILELKNEVEKNYALNLWSERFTAADKGERKCGQALRVMSTNMEKIRRALLWLQRDYISEMFSNYDPTSGRDEDLPIDLDHIVPHSIFHFDWRNRFDRFSSEYHEWNDLSKNFWDGRDTIGNSLGNFRWIDSIKNRSRQDGTFTPLLNEWDLVCEDSSEKWNRLIQNSDGSKPKWGGKEIAEFQHLIDKRTIYLYEQLVNSSGIREAGFIIINPEHQS